MRRSAILKGKENEAIGYTEREGYLGIIYLSLEHLEYISVELNELSQQVETSLEERRWAMVGLFVAAVGARRTRPFLVSLLLLLLLLLPLLWERGDHFHEIPQ